MHGTWKRGMARWLAVPAAVALLALPASPAYSRTFLNESFAGPATDWTRGTGWQIGPAAAGGGMTLGNPDPSVDTSPSPDNRLAGVVIGGNVSTTPQPYAYLESPTIDLRDRMGPVYLTFRRWLNTDPTPLMQNRVEVWDGLQWVLVWQSGGAGIFDSSWKLMALDVSAYASPFFRVRFGYSVLIAGAHLVSGWNVDDVTVADSCEPAFLDADGDGYGSATAPQGCAGTPGYVTNDLDCDDSRFSVHPGAPEFCNGIDDNCNGGIDENVTSRTYYRDADGDQYGVSNVTIFSCAPPAGYVPTPGDCNDANPTIHPGAPELCNGTDDDCDGSIDENVSLMTYYRDVDGDQYGVSNATIVACAPPAGYVSTPGDCNDANASIHPGATEMCNGIDDNCNGAIDEGTSSATYYRDSDGDQYGVTAASVVSCTPVSGYALAPGDCDDTDPLIHPGAPERLNGRDDDCDGLIDESFEGPMIRSIRDVGNDQGRWVRLRWRSDLRDAAGPQSPVITGYAIYRRVGPGQMPALRAALGGEAATALPPGQWDIVMTAPATADTAYQTVVPTLCDSTESGVCWSTFVVRSLTSSAVIHFDSQVDSGYSVDNLAPPVPESFTARVLASGVSLAWQSGAAPDSQYFRVYRGAAPGFALGPERLVATTGANDWTDAAPDVSQPCYQVTAVDYSGNESPAAASSVVFGPSGPELPTALALTSIAPNPFGGRTTVHFAVPADGSSITLTVIDLAGRRVRSLANGRWSGGQFTRDWDGSDDSGRRSPPGIYLVQLRAGATTLTRRVALTY